MGTRLEIRAHANRRCSLGLQASGLGVGWPCPTLEVSGTCQLYSPDRTARIEWTLCLDEGWGFTAENPYVHVRRLLPHETCQEPGDTSDFHLHDIMHGLMAEASNCKRFLALGEDRKLDEPRLWCG